jgi:hypothetical protein
VADSLQREDENPPKTEDSVAGAYMNQLLQLLERDSNPREVAVAFAQRIGNKHFLSALAIIAEMDRLYREMRSVLDEFTGRRSFVFKVLTIEHLAMVMKLYVISWHTMLDLLARLVNVIFNLGIAERDVSLRLILNNDHVKLSPIPGIVQKYEQTLVINDLRKRRNDAVHRGKIPDPDLESLLGERNTIDSRRYSLLQPTPISDEEHKKQRSELQTRLGILSETKQELWERVHAQTIVMTFEVARELAAKTVELYRKGAI